MKKIKRLFIISIIVGIVSMVISVLSYFNAENLFRDSEFYKLSAIFSFVTSALITAIYVYLALCKGEKAIQKKGMLVLLSICSLFSPIILLIMNFITINAITGYIFDKRIKQSSMIYIRPQVSLNERNFNQNDLNATLLAKEYKRLKTLREQNAISEEEYQKMRNILLSKIGLDASEVEEIDHNVETQ